MINKLRDEIIEAEKSRVDLLKWKFISIAALGSIALGVGVKNPSEIISQEATLCLIPLVCVYVDLLCKHLNLRILVISEFIKTFVLTEEQKKLTEGEQELIFHQEYEKFCATLRQRSNKDFLEKFKKFISDFEKRCLAMQYRTISYNFRSNESHFSARNLSKLSKKCERIKLYCY